MTTPCEVCGEKPATCVQEDLYGLACCNDCCDHEPIEYGEPPMPILAQCTPIADVVVS